MTGQDPASSISKKVRPIRVDDLVEIVIPQYVLRVGYPKCPADYVALVRQQHEAALRTIYGFHSNYATTAKLPRQLQRAIQDLAYLACQRDGFGGKERRIHLSGPDERLRGRRFRVDRTRMVQEGDYYPPYSGRSYEGEYDYEPGGLLNQRSRRLATSHIWVAADRRAEFPVEHLLRIEIGKAADDENT